MSKRISISTYCTPTSHGSILQAYALKQKLLSMGCDSCINFWYNKKQPKDYLRECKIKNIKDVIVNLYRFLKKDKLVKQYSKSQKFIDERIDIKYFNNYESLRDNIEEYDYYLSGSDQVFNPISCFPTFFLDFAKEREKRITYAVSMGTTNIPQKNEDRFSKYLNNFDYISVREKDNCEIIKKYSNANTTVNIDPTFLLSVEQWRQLECPYTIKEPYILIYSIYWDKKINKEVMALHKKTGLKVYVLSTGLNRVWGNKKIFDAGVQEFLWLIDHAKYIITSSFHGVAMSTIFNKQFSAVIDPSKPSRIKGLFDTLEIDNIPIEDLSDKSIEYNKVNANIKAEQIRSDNYLRQVLKIG